MKKSISATVVTLLLAVTIIGGNAIFATNMLENEIPDISAEFIPAKTIDQHTDAKANGAITTALQRDTKVLESEAIEIAKAAMTDSYDVNIDGLRIFTALGQTEKTTENVWFVSFLPVEFTNEAEKALQEGRRFDTTTAVFTTYVLLINADTGEIMEMKQNTIDRANILKDNPELDGPGLG